MTIGLRLIMLTIMLTGFFTTAKAADKPRLAVWLTKEPLGLNDSCPSAATDESADLPDTPPTLTEQDVVGWNKRTARWTLNPAHFPSASLRNHCFILALDGKRISNGVAVADYSERLIRFPVLRINDLRGKLELHLASCLCTKSRPIHVDEIDAVLGNVIFMRGSRDH